jgi:uncharacterized protein (DUF433 family)/DNA-binding transcriptional MerR regulator
VAYPTPVAAALSGATVRQLSYWRSQSAPQGPLLVPEYRPSGGRVLYSFRDVIALRSFVFLREAQSLQRIRRAVSNLKELGDREHLSAYRFVVIDDSIYLVEPSEAEHAAPQRVTNLGTNKGAGRMVIMLGDILKPFATKKGTKVVDLYRPRPNLEVDPEVRGGFPVIRSTRVPYDQVATLVADGLPARDVASFYPGVSAAAARDALSFDEFVQNLREAA